MKTKILLTILTIAILSSPLFAQRDSLCMRTVDEWFEADSVGIMCIGMTIYEDLIYVSYNGGLSVFSISDSGHISKSTTLLERTPWGPNFCFKDTIGMAIIDDDLILLSLSNPTMPDSIYTYSHLSEYTIQKFFVSDSILLTQEYTSYNFDRYNISNPFDISEIPTYFDSLNQEIQFITGYTRAVDFPYAYTWRLPRFGENVILYSFDLSAADSLHYLRMGSIAGSYVEAEPTCMVANDTIVYVSYAYGGFRTFKTNFDRDSLFLLDTYEEFIMDDFVTFKLYDETIFYAADGYIKVFDVSDPEDIELTAFYEDPESDFKTMVYIDSFLIVNTSTSFKVFKYPCPECDGNCELRDIPKDLEIKTYPNPFNDKCRISIDNKIEYANQSISIYDLKGRKVLEENTSSLKHDFIWDAQDEPKGIYLVELSNGKMKNTRKVFLIK